MVINIIFQIIDYGEFFFFKEEKENFVFRDETRFFSYVYLTVSFDLFSHTGDWGGGSVGDRKKDGS